MKRSEGKGGGGGWRAGESHLFTPPREKILSSQTFFLQEVSHAEKSPMSNDGRVSAKMKGDEDGSSDEQKIS